MTAFSFSKTLGKAGGLALDEDFAKLAKSGRVHHVLIAVGAAHGVTIPAAKITFDGWSVTALQPGAWGCPIAAQRAIARCVLAIRPLLGLSELPAPDWLDGLVRKAPVRKDPLAAALELVSAAIGAGILHPDQRTALMTALAGAGAGSPAPAPALATV